MDERLQEWKEQTSREAEVCAETTEFGSPQLGPPGSCPFSPLVWLGDSVPLLKQTENKSGILILTSLLEDLVVVQPFRGATPCFIRMRYI